MGNRVYVAVIVCVVLIAISLAALHGLRSGQSPPTTEKAYAGEHNIRWSGTTGTGQDNDAPAAGNAFVVEDNGTGDDQPASDGFKDSLSWEAFDAGSIDGLQTKGYFGAVFDGRYVYYVPNRMKNFHGTVMRYDTQGGFTSLSSWESYDAGSTDGLDTRGYAGGVFDGRYVYFVPFSVESTRHARVLRYDTQGVFKDASSWDAYDASVVGGRGAFGYDGAVFDSRYVYISPFGYDPYAHAKVLRYDTQTGFKEASGWKVYDASNIGGLNTKGYYGAGFDSRFIYFVPFNDGSAFHGRVLRYDTEADFSQATSWAAYDAGNTGGKETVGYKGAVFDGRYMYFVPFRNSGGVHGIVLRYDTVGFFTAALSWSAYDAGSTDGLDTRGYVGGEFDGRYVYFIPYSYDENVFHAKFLRYDTQGDFINPGSWDAYDAGNAGGLKTEGYKYGVRAGEYIYFAPYSNTGAFSGTALRYKIN